MRDLSFKIWLNEVGSGGGPGSGLAPQKTLPQDMLKDKKVSNAMPQFNIAEEPPVGWSQPKFMNSGRKTKKKVKK